jgi:plastocyanin
MRITPLALVAVAVAATVTACGSDGGGVSLDGKKFVDRQGRRSVTIDAVDNSFEPEYVAVSAGTKITFTNSGRNRHDVIAVDHGFTDVEPANFTPDDSVTVTFSTPGDYPYYCSLHGTPTKGMIGGIRVVA